MLLSPIPSADAQVLLALLDRWLDRFDSVSSAGARRLSALALCVALTIPLPAVLDRLDVIAACLTAVAAEVSSNKVALVACCRLQQGSGGRGIAAGARKAARHASQPQLLALHCWL